MAPARSHAFFKLLLFALIFLLNLKLRSDKHNSLNREHYRNNLHSGKTLESYLVSDKCDISAFNLARILNASSATNGSHDSQGPRDFEGNLLPPGASKGKHCRAARRGSVSLLQQLVLLLALSGDVQTNPGPPAGHDLNYFYSNFRSILGADRLHSFNSSFCDGETFDIIAGTETWLKDHINNSEILGDKYEIFRDDRPGERSGGGALLAVSTKLRSRPLSPPPIPGCEQAWCMVSLEDGRRLAAGVVYMPPAPDPTTLEHLGASLAAVRTELKDDDSLLLWGDFNLPGIEWVTNEHAVISPSLATRSLPNCSMLEVIAENDLVQHVSTPTRGAHFLDLIFSSSNIERVDVHPSHLDFIVDHMPLEGTVTLPSPPLRQPVVDRTYYNWRRADIPGLQAAMSACPWHLIDATDSGDEAAETFYDLLHAAIRDNVPLTKLRPQRFPRWFDDAVINAYNSKRRAHRKFKRSRADQDYFAFSHARCQFKLLADAAHLKYVHEIEDNIKVNPKKLFKFMQQKSKTKRLPNGMCYNLQPLDDAKATANAFSEYFRDNLVPNINNDDKTDIKNNFLPNKPFMSIHANDIQVKIMNLNCSKSSGSDLIPVNVLKALSYQISVPLCSVFNKIIVTGHYPTKWKLAKICPVFKKGQKCNIINYRPISILPLFSKLFESFIYDELYTEIKYFLPDSQHGFLPKRSTVSNLAQYTYFMSQSFKFKRQTDSIYIDFAKAFDRVPHHLLLRKLKTMSVNSNLLFLIQNYLSSRQQIVTVDNVCSNSVHVSSGVIQGSILGPLLFNAYVSDLPNCLEHANCSMYADDSKIYMQISNISDCLLLQSDINHLQAWCNEWLMELNFDKCESITFTNKPRPLQFSYYLGDNELERVSDVVDLGVSVATDLSYDIHIENQCKKAARMLGFVRRASRDFSADTLRHLYISLVRPVLEYASVVWSPHHVTKIDRLERIQRSFLRAWCHKRREQFRKEDYIRHCREARIHPLYTRRQIHDLIFLHKIIRGGVNSSSLLESVYIHAPPRYNRVLRVFRPPYARIDVCLHHFCYRAQRQYCDLVARPDCHDIDIFTMSLPQFKWRICHALF